MAPPATPNPYNRHRFPGEIISHAVWLYYRFARKRSPMAIRRKPFSPSIPQPVWRVRSWQPPPMPLRLGDSDRFGLRADRRPICPLG
jgi:hypothetical protein